jgi:hypothetical protein
VESTPGPASSSEPAPTETAAVVSADLEAAATVAAELESQASIPQQAAAQMVQLDVASIAAVSEPELEPALTEATPASAEATTVLPGSVASVQLQQSVGQWIEAWQSQSLQDYFRHYHPEFKPRYQDTLAAWRRNRERVIANAEWIRLEKSEFEVIGEEEGVIEVQFWLSYASPNYGDNTHKKLLLANADGQWRILEEINLEVRS